MQKGKDFYRLKKLLSKFPLYKDSTLVGPDVNKMDECPERFWINLMMVKVRSLMLKRIFKMASFKMTTLNMTDISTTVNLY